jgi:peptide/nickel transport system substrate-binding protein
VTVWTPRGAERGSAYFVSQLRAVGYDARLKIVGERFDTYFPKLEKAVKTVQVGVTGWGVDYLSPSDFFSLLTCASSNGPNSANFGAFCDPHIDREMAAAARLQASDPQAADALWSKVDHDLVDQAPWVAKNNGRNVVFVSRRVGNVEYNPFYTVLLDQLWVR